MATNWTYVIYFISSAFEGNVTNVVGGALIKEGYFDFWPVVSISIVANILADYMFYFLGYCGAGKLAGKILEFLKVNNSRVGKFKTSFIENEAKAIIIGKLAFGTSVAILISAGILRVKFWNFTKYIVPVVVLKSSFLIFFGYLFSNAQDMLIYGIRWSSIIITIILIVFIYIRLRKVKDRI